MKWTSVSELPDRDGSYLVWAPESYPKNTQCVVAEFYSDNGKFYSESGSVMSDVTHWMNLPDDPTTPVIDAKSGYIQHIRDLDDEVKRLRDIKLVRFHNDDCWLWQGDGYDYPDSLVCPVVMSADTLRGLLGMIEPEVPKVGEVSATVRGYFDRVEMNKLLNLHWLGSDAACELADDGHTIVAKVHPDMDKLRAAQYRMSHGFCASVVVDLYADGTKGNPRILKAQAAPKRVVLD